MDFWELSEKCLTVLDTKVVFGAESYHEGLSKTIFIGHEANGLVVLAHELGHAVEFHLCPKNAYYRQALKEDMQAGWIDPALYHQARAEGEIVARAIAYLVFKLSNTRTGEFWSSMHRALGCYGIESQDADSLLQMLLHVFGDRVVEVSKIVMDIVTP